MAQNEIPGVVQSANALMDDVRRSTNPIMMRLYGRLILTFISPVLIMMVAGWFVTYARELVGNATGDWLMVSTVTFVGLMIGFLLARAVWQIMENRYHGVALFRQFLAVASAMAQLRKSMKKQIAGEFVSTADFDAQSAALEEHCRVYLAGMRDAGLEE